MERSPQSSILGFTVITFLPVNGKTCSESVAPRTREFANIRQARLGDIADDTPPIW